MTGESKLIFFVEDDPLMIRMYERIFKLNGFTTEMAFNGEDAIKKLREMTAAPSIILLDVMMPKMNGFDLLKLIKEDPKLKDVPVLMLSNLAGKEDADHALALGAREYLIKSEYPPKEVVEKIRGILEG